MTLPRNETRTLIEGLVEAYNSRNVDQLGDLYHSDARYWSALEGWIDGLPAIKAHIEHLHDVLPDEQMAMGAMVTDGDVAVVEFTSSGSSRPSNEPYSISFTEVFELHDGKISSVKVYLDPDDVVDVTA